MTRQTIVVIGAGASGALTASHLLRLRNGRTALDVQLIDPRTDTGRGVAYSTEDLRHILNVPAGNMSADPHDPDHFLRWLRETHTPLATAKDFVPRKWFGEYVDSVLPEAAGPSLPFPSLRQAQGGAAS